MNFHLEKRGLSYYFNISVLVQLSVVFVGFVGSVLIYCLFSRTAASLVFVCKQRYLFCFSGSDLIIYDFILFSSLRQEISSCNSFKTLLPSGETSFSSRCFCRTYIFSSTKDFKATSSTFILQVCSS